MAAKRHGYCIKCNWNGPCEAGVLVEHTPVDCSPGRCDGSGLLPVGGEPITPEELLIETRERFLAEADPAREAIYTAKVVRRFAEFKAAIIGAKEHVRISYFGLISKHHSPFVAAMLWADFERGPEMVKVWEERMARNLQTAAPPASRFVVLDGVDGHPLGCDCYGGCWGDHSESWPRLLFTTKADADEAARLCHQEPGRGHVPRPKDDRPPYGSNVLSGRELRFCTTALRDKHAARLNTLWAGPTPEGL